MVRTDGEDRWRGEPSMYARITSIPHKQQSQTPTQNQSGAVCSPSTSAGSTCPLASCDATLKTDSAQTPPLPPSHLCRVHPPAGLGLLPVCCRLHLRQRARHVGKQLARGDQAAQQWGGQAVAHRCTEDRWEGGEGGGRSGTGGVSSGAGGWSQQ